VAAVVVAVRWWGAGRAALVAVAVLMCAPAGARAALSVMDNTPFSRSPLIVGASWTSRAYAPPRNQWGDILPTVWADDGDQYTTMDDGGTDISLSGGYWKQSLARITGPPPDLHFSHVGDRDRPPPATRQQIRRDGSLWNGPLGPYYSSGLVEADRVFFATQQRDWAWAANGPFGGLSGIAYSTDRGGHWTTPAKPFPAPLGNLSWVIRGRGGFYPDGYVYAVATTQEFNASGLIVGRSRPGIADMTDPSRWEWLSGFTGQARAPVYSSSLPAAVPVVSWASHITYPQMAYDSPLHRYLLTFTYSYVNAPPAIWRNGSELVILDAPHPWGPFTFVAREPYFGASNGYAAGFPIQWISRDGRTLWMKYSANFDGCAAHLACTGGYGFDYRQLRLTLAGDAASRQHRAVTGRTQKRNTPHPRSTQWLGADGRPAGHPLAHERRAAERGRTRVRLRGLPRRAPRAVDPQRFGNH